MRVQLGDHRIWLAFLSGFGVMAFVVRDIGHTSPGDLATVHGRDPELATRSGCATCHGGGERSMAASCLECHAEVAHDIGQGEGLHGTLEGEVRMQCALCHSEHHGPDFTIVNERSFAIAGVEDPDAFPHELVGFAMAGKHLELACADCHPNAYVPILPEGQRRFIAEEQNCATCHDDPHEGGMLRGCAECHAQEAFDMFDGFVHDERFPLTGSHDGLTCQECHTDDGAHAIEVLGMSKNVEWRACADCHESPHASSFVDGIAQLVEATSEASCAACHDVAHETFGLRDIDVTPEQHATTGFPLDLPHDRAACEDCHSAPDDTFEARFPGRGADDCRSCHDDPHAGQFDDAPFAAAGCIACHDRHTFDPHTYTAQDHALAALPLEGSHADAECNACHLAALGGARVFHGTGSNCEDCHADAHKGFFGRSQAGLPPVPNGDCARCHTATSFHDLPLEGFDHSFWTGFDLNGAHGQNDCESCHGRSAQPDEAGRTFGWSTELFGRVEGCASCHADPHEGVFDREGVPVQLDGPDQEPQTGCERCHVETSFRTFPHDFDHGVWTGFALDGAHGDVSCAACHPPLVGSAAVPGERTSARALGQSCADCHASPHAGQFRIEGQTDCSRCHQSTDSFSELAFDHDEDSRFPLDAAHAALSCTACHKPYAVTDELEIVRYKPLGTACIDCHGMTEGQLRERGRRKR